MNSYENQNVIYNINMLDCYFEMTAQPLPLLEYSIDSCKCDWFWMDRRINSKYKAS